VDRWWSWSPRQQQQRSSQCDMDSTTAAAEPAQVVVRPGRRDEAGLLLEMIRELAELEKELEQVKITVDTLQRDGWPLPAEVAAGAAPKFEVLFAEADGVVVGMALFFHNYSTWEGLGVYLEDLYVKPSFRSRGIGTALICGVAQKAEERGCARLQWQVIDFNEPAIKYYRSLGARERVEKPVDGFDGKWLNYICDREAIRNIAAGAK
jgi:GNAT superfamily N-acetyltransferase